jgi:hypothetical protein
MSNHFIPKKGQKYNATNSAPLARMNKSCCFVLQYNTEALVLVLQYYFGRQAILKQYQKNMSEHRCAQLMWAFQIE